MDRMRIAGPTLLATIALLGQQGARLGSFVVPELGLHWAGVALVLAALTKPTQDGPALGVRELAVAATLLVCFIALTSWRASALSPPLALTLTMDDGSTVPAGSLQLEARRELRRLSGRRRNVSFSTNAILEVPRDGEFRFTLECDDSCTMDIGELRLRGGETVTLERGDVPLALSYRQLGGPAHLRFSWNTPALIELLPIEYFLRAPTGAARNADRRSARLTLLLLTLWWVALSLWVVRLAPRRLQLYQRRLIPASAIGVLVLYGSLLRFDAFLIHSGRDGHEHLRTWVPSYGVFNPANATDDPYRADVRSYLERAETFSLRSFYAASFREPFYVALTLPFLALSGGEIGILIQSLFFSCATLVLFAGVATKLHGLWWAAALSAPIALHEWLILEAPTGYRMSAYAFFLLLTVAIMFAPSSTRARALSSGVASAALCLIRLSALSVVAPLLAVKLLPLGRRERLAFGGIVVAVLIVLVGPFLASNAVTHGDPFYAVSFHTQFWMRAEGLDASGGPVSLARYFTDFDRAGDVVRGTFLGMTALPLRTFWRGLHHFWLLDAAILTLGALGLVLSVRSRHRYLPAAYVCHLIPFAYVQNFPSGQMPRFVMPAYLFLVLAVPVAVRSVTRYSAAKEKISLPALNAAHANQNDV